MKQTKQNATITTGSKLSVKSSILALCCSLLWACTSQETQFNQSQGQDKSASAEPALVPAATVQQKVAADINQLANTLTDRWQLERGAIRWRVKDAHQDHLEMSGEQLSAIIYYGADDQGELLLRRKIVWPLLRTVPNDTHASLIHQFDTAVSPTLRLNGQKLSSERPSWVQYNGLLKIHSKLNAGLSLTRTLTPSPTAAYLVEQHELHNQGSTAVTVQVGAFDKQYQTEASKGVDGSYVIRTQSNFSGELVLQPDESKSYQLTFSAVRVKDKAIANIDAQQAADTLLQRRQYVTSLQQKLQLETPDPVINQMFEFAKLRAAESIYRTKGGLMHGPGGGRYYAAIWANDQAEYVNPFFPFLGDANGNESAMVSFSHFARFINPEFKPLPSSIVAEGLDIWNGVGDRGDCAMVAYGASRYALASGDKNQAQQLLPLINWCLEFNQRKTTKEGVIASDTDELENRFEAGEVNLSTNMLAYGALVSSGHLHQALGDHAKAKTLQQKAATLRSAINSYFAAEVEGFATYRYYEGNTKLRAWIALPLVMGFHEQKQGTLAALLSSQLWTENGILTESGAKTFWDRATLYAFRGIFAAGETDTAMQYLKYYSRKRLLGDHVPFAVEAWPEGDQRHLSAESGLYARVITEGLFGIEPTGFNEFSLAPHLPSSWNSMCLRHIRAFASNFDICVQKQPSAETPYLIDLVLHEGGTRQYQWDGIKPLTIAL